MECKYWHVWHTLDQTANLIKLLNLNCIISTQYTITSVQATKTLVSAFALSQLDYCNSLLSGCLLYLLNRLQKVQNNAAYLAWKATWTDHITPQLHTLHGLPINARIKHKISSLRFSAIIYTGPVYLSDLLTVYVPYTQLWSFSHILHIPPVNSKSHSKCFLTLLQLCNTLWIEIRFL